MTEGILCSATPDMFIPGTSVGLVVPNTQLKVISITNGDILGAYEEGEICGKGPQVMKGYYKNPAATALCIDSEGWLHTGDIGYYDEYRCLYIVDRLKELIKYKGFQVAPAELESILLSHPKISDAAVIGIDDSKAGEVPKAFIVRSDNSLTAEDIHAYFRQMVSSYKYLRGGIVFCDVIPKSASGKILRRELKAMQQKSKL